MNRVKIIRTTLFKIYLAILMVFSPSRMFCQKALSEFSVQKPSHKASKRRLYLSVNMIKRGENPSPLWVKAFYNTDASNLLIIQGTALIGHELGPLSISVVIAHQLNTAEAVHNIVILGIVTALE